MGGEYYAEWERDEGDVAPLNNNTDDSVWGGLGNDGRGRLYQNIGTVDLVTYTVAGYIGRQDNNAFNKIQIELWATTSFTGGNGTDVAGSGTLLDSATLTELGLFGDTESTAVATPFSVDLTVSGNTGEDLWVAFAATESAGDDVSTGNTSEVQLIDDISVIPEPSSLILLLVGGVAVLGRRRCRRA